MTLKPASVDKGQALMKRPRRSGFSQKENFVASRGIFPIPCLDYSLIRAKVILWNATWFSANDRECKVRNVT